MAKNMNEIMGQMAGRTRFELAISDLLLALGAFGGLKQPQNLEPSLNPAVGAS